MDRQRVGRRARLLDPQGAEQRELLALRFAGADRQAARVEAVGLAAREAAEKGRALEDGELAPALVVAGAQHPDAGKADVGEIGRRLQLAEVEGAAVVDQAARLAVLDDVDLHRRGEDEAALQGLERKADLLVAPDRRIGVVVDRQILLGGEIGEGVGQRRARRLERRLGELARHVEHAVGGKGRRLRHRRGRGDALQRDSGGGESPAEGQLEEFPTRALCHDALRSRCGPLADDGLAAARTPATRFLKLSSRLAAFASRRGMKRASRGAISISYSGESATGIFDCSSKA